MIDLLLNGWVWGAAWVAILLLAIAFCAALEQVDHNRFGHVDYPWEGDVAENDNPVTGEIA